ATLDCSIRMAQLTRTIGCSASVADQLVDYMTWWIFWIIAGRWLASHPFFVSRMCRKCALASPSHGPWKNRVKGEYPFLFWRPQWLALLLYKAARAFLPAPVKRRLRQYSPGLLKATKALLRYLFESIRGILPRPAKRVAKQVLTFINGFMVRVRLGVSVLPLSYLWGFDRGLPIHRYYLQEFLQEFASDIRGHCLEFQDAAYTPRFGGSAVAKLDILHIDDRNQSATIVADLTKSNDIPSNIFDCIVCTHVLHVIFELNKAVKELYRVLKPGGVLLVTVPHVSMCDPGSKEIWRFTPDGLYLVLAQVFGEPNVTVRAYGNSLTAAGEIRGLVAHEFVKGELDHHDSRFAVEVCARAIKPGLS
ncbi:MAG: methyltransferase domain-containing protein, partial [Candidatus Binatia bacterium]